MIQFQEETEAMIKAAARNMDAIDKLGAVETIAGNLELKLMSLAGLCHQARRMDVLDQEQVLGLAYLLEDLAKEARACVSIICPGKSQDEDTEEN